MGCKNSKLQGKAFYKPVGIAAIGFPGVILRFPFRICLGNQGWAFKFIKEVIEDAGIAKSLSCNLIQ